MKQLILAGGGHAHLFVLETLARHTLPGVEVLLVTPSRYQIYSGMLPGWMSGHYSIDQCRIDLEPLARAARARLVIDRITRVQAESRKVLLADGSALQYDLLSLDIGSETQTSSLQDLGQKLLPVKPLDEFFECWPRLMAAARSKPAYRLGIVGGGAAGVELALAARHALTRSRVDARVDLVVLGDGLLAGHAPGVKRRIERILAASGVSVHALQAKGTTEGLLLSDGSLLPLDGVIAATGARPPRGVELDGLQLDSSAYVAVDATYRSRSHRDVFAAGDVSARQDQHVARSGVHAVHAGPILGANLLAALQGGTMQTYTARRHSLYLLACGPRYAVASWGRWSAQGRWVWHWKDWIDRRFIGRFARNIQISRRRV